MRIGPHTKFDQKDQQEWIDGVRLSGKFSLFSFHIWKTYETTL